MNVLFNIVMGSLVCVALFMLFYGLWTVNKEQKAFIAYIKANRQIGYIDISKDGRAIFVRTNPDGTQFGEPLDVKSLFDGSKES